MRLKNEKGVTLMILVITIIVITIITSITVYNYKDQFSVKKVNNLYADIESISTKVSAYYLEHDSLPKLDKAYVTNKENLLRILNLNVAEGTVLKDTILNPNDGDKYYVIDLAKLENLTLNYGKDYNKWKSSANPYNMDCLDLYIINEVSHQIYYPKGIVVNDTIYFTRDADVGEINSIANVNGEYLFEIVEPFTVTVEEKNEKCTITSNFQISANPNYYVLSTLKYSWAENNIDNLESLEYTSFSLNGNNVNIVSGPLDNSKQEYYLYLQILDLNGEKHYIKRTVTK